MLEVRRPLLEPAVPQESTLLPLTTGISSKGFWWVHAIQNGFFHAR